MIITTTGYYATGSSAVFNLLEEYSSCTAGKLAGGDYENVVFYTPDGLFDLEDKLLVGNSIHRSDEAIKKFIKRMDILDRNDFIWMGGYKKMYGDAFRKNYMRFAQSLVQYNLVGHWQGHYEGNKYNLRYIAGGIKNKLLRKPIVGDFGKTAYFNSDASLLYSFATSDEFYAKGREFVKNYFEMLLEGEKKNLIINHAILPHNLFRVPNYFAEDFRVVVVDRDPRDVYVQVRYKKKNQRIPTDIKEFVSFWKRLRESEKRIDDYRIIRVQFEDLIYRYEETKKYIEDKCCLDAKAHVAPQTIFKPSVSIKNTHMYDDNPVWKEEIKYIEEELSEYLYDYDAVL